MDNCPLCQALDNYQMYEDKHRPYRHCRVCNLVFVPAAYYLTAAAEKAHYDLHQNSPDDLRYRGFLNRLCAPLLERLSPHSHGLDFGCGPGPTLSVMLQEMGHTVALYDQFYAPHPAVFEQQYDFITASEVVEHLQRPWLELNRLWDCLKSGGTLGLMTQPFLNPEAFQKWHYIRDLTHICFFSRPTFQWLAKQWETEAEFVGQDVVFLRKRQNL